MWILINNNTLYLKLTGEPTDVYNIILIQFCIYKNLRKEKLSIFLMITDFYVFQIQKYKILIISTVAVTLNLRQCFSHITWKIK